MGCRRGNRISPLAPRNIHPPSSAVPQFTPNRAAACLRPASNPLDRLTPEDQRVAFGNPWPCFRTPFSSMSSRTLSSSSQAEFCPNRPVSEPPPSSAKGDAFGSVILYVYPSAPAVRLMRAISTASLSFTSGQSSTVATMCCKRGKDPFLASFPYRSGTPCHACPQTLS